MGKHMRTIAGIITGFIFFSFGGCRQSTEEEIQAAIDAAVSTAMMIYTVVTTYSATIDINTLLSDDGCPQVDINGTPGNRSVNISYADNCSVDGISLSGDLAGAWTFAQGQGVSIDMTLEDFRVADHRTSGELALQADALQGAVVTVDGYVTIDGQTLTVDELQATANLQQTLLDPLDDTYSLNGSGSYLYNSTHYELDFSSVTAGFGCYVPVSGTITLKSSTSLFPVSIDFGNGTCDTVFEVSAGRVTRDVNLVDWLEGL
ncbi:MAG: hypothetical protein GY868_04835 [Deltaproteobacteria bacterium]|nr:hypothetical protein [Deltaproteobacteria bacterium]